MKKLIIYDNEGYIYTQIQGYKEPQGGIHYLEVNADDYANKIIKGVNVKTKELIMEDAPKTETQLLQEKVEQLENDMANLMLEKATQRGNK